MDNHGAGFCLGVLTKTAIKINKKLRPYHSVNRFSFCAFVKLEEKSKEIEVRRFSFDSFDLVSIASLITSALWDGVRLHEGIGKLK